MPLDEIRPCVLCARGFYEECGHEPPTEVTAPVGKDTNSREPTVPEVEKEPGTRGRPVLDAEDVTDPHSTGRKRAARMYPLDREAPCEWQAASETNPLGGGLNPVVVGCTNTQANRHHGPDKNTLNNSEGNVHRICAFHHNVWHSQNDKSRLEKTKNHRYMKGGSASGETFTDSDAEFPEAAPLVEVED